ncbi:MAG: undecaprenyl-diphosphate phosphatase [Spirochaetales bacterium]
MTYVESILLGVLQGITEFLPVSSSGHLVVVRSLMGLGEIPVLYDVLLHVATLVVVLGVFRGRVLRILAALWRWASGRAREAEDNAQLRAAVAIIVATVVTGAFGLGIERLGLGSYPRLAGVMFVVTGGILLLSRRLHGSRGFDTLRVRDGAFVGLAQAFGVVPGISRSGITITASLAAGLSRERAGELAFLVFVPAVLGALVVTLREAEELSAAVGPGVLAAGFATSLVVGFVALKGLLTLIRSGRLYLFAFYLIPLGILTVAFV